MNEQETKDVVKSTSKISAPVVVTKQEVNTSFKVLNLLNKEDEAAAENFLSKLVKTEKGGIKSVSEGLAILMRAQDLKLPFSTCIEHIHVINAKTGVDIHIVKALLSRAGTITWHCTKDYVPQYNYTDGSNIYNETQLPDYCVKCRNAKEAEEKTNNDVVGVYPVKYYADLKGNIYNQFQISSACVVALNRQHAIKLANENKFPIMRIAPRPIDYITEYKFDRYRKINGKVVIQTATSHFSYSEAAAADFFKKDTYVKYARIMIGHRAFTLGARDIASDLLMGVMTTDELKLVENKPLNPNDFDANITDAEVIDAHATD